MRGFVQNLLTVQTDTPDGFDRRVVEGEDSPTALPLDERDTFSFFFFV